MPPIDDLKSPSIVENTPTFSLSNVFKPTAKKVVIFGTFLKLIAVGGTGVAAYLATTDPRYAAVTTFLFILLGAFGESIILFTKEEPVTSLIRASEDIKLDIVQAIEAKQAQSDTQPIEPLHES